MNTILKQMKGWMAITLILLFVFQLHAEKPPVVFPDAPLKPINTKDKKRKDEFKVYAGISFNSLNVDPDVYKSSITPGWMLGFSYKRGSFFYWELGARYGNPVHFLEEADIPADSSNIEDDLFALRSIDVPLSFGINFLSFASRIVGLRVFIGATPEFVLGVGSNELGITRDDINTFNILGHGGIGVDIAFLYVEGGINYGFMDLFSDKDYASNPFQVYACLGFRF